MLGGCKAPLVYPDGGHLDDLSHPVHGCQVEPAIVLLLSQVKQGYARALLVIRGEAAEDLCHLQCRAELPQESSGL